MLSVEVGGRWSTETQSFRWGSLLSSAAARAVAMSLLELQGAQGADGHTLATHEVESDHRCTLVLAAMCFSRVR